VRGIVTTRMRDAECGSTTRSASRNPALRVPYSVLLGALLATAATSPLAAQGTVLTDTLYSQALGTRKAFVVYLPPSYARDTARRYPVAYYLHGHWGSETDWTRQGALAPTMDSLVAAGMPEMIVVMPDGDDGWYTTWNSLGRYRACMDGPSPGPHAEPRESYCVPWPKYDDYVARDLVAFTDSNYRTHADRAHRGIAGLSMGGYGAVTLALNYPDVFAAAWSHSGFLATMLVADSGRTREARSIEELRELRRGSWYSMGPAFGEDTIGWRARDPATLLRRALGRGGRGELPALGFDVGRDDFFLPQNRAFARALDSLGVRHDYAEHPGRHDWAYWRAHLPESARWLARHIAAR
jgi:putative tributyrin esterase